MARRLRVEFAKNDANVRAREADRRSTAEPNNTLFVAGFDPRATRSRDLERAFEGFGTLTRCEVKSTFAFVEFEKLEDAKEAHDDMHHRKLNGREITVEYVLKKSGGGGGGGGGRDREGGRGRRDDRNGRDRDRGGYGGRRDDRDRDRGHGGGRDDRGRRDDRGFGGRGRGGRSRSRSYDRDNRRRRSPSYSRSPPPRRGRSPAPRRSPPKDDRRRSRSPYRSPPRAASPDRSYSPMRGADE